MKKSSYYFVSPPTRLTVKPDFLERAKMCPNNATLIGTRPAIENGKLKRGPVYIAGTSPLPVGLRIGSDDASAPENMHVDDVPPPPFDEVNDDADYYSQVPVTPRPMWWNLLMDYITRWYTQKDKIPLLFHFPAELDATHEQLLHALLSEVDMASVWIKGSEEDDSTVLSQLRAHNPVMTCLTEPDSRHMQAAWSHLSSGNIWLWCSPFPPSWLSPLQYTRLPVEFRPQNIPDQPERITLVDRVALFQQINSLKTGNNDQSRYSYLHNLAKPKQLILATEAHLEKMKALQLQHPQFEVFLRKMSNRILLQAAQSLPLHLGNILLAGAPGNGKTWLCEQIATALDVPFLSIQLAGTNDIMILRGSSRQWGSADAGRPAKFIADCRVANPIIMIDEVDKTSDSTQGNPVEALLMLLEPENARRFMDNFVEPPINMSHISFILTANDLTNLKDYFTTRVEIIEILPPTAADMRTLAQQLYHQQLQHLKAAEYFEDELQEQELALLMQDCNNIRTLKQRINQAIENALWETPDLATLRSQVKCLRIKPSPIIIPPQRNIGFLPNN